MSVVKYLLDTYIRGRKEMGIVFVVQFRVQMGFEDVTLRGSSYVSVNRSLPLKKITLEAI